MGYPWISWGILMLAYFSYGQFLHDSGVEEWVWLLNIGCAIALAGAFTLLWSPTRNLILKGFQSDVGYSVMVLVLAAAAVVAVVQFRVTAYLLVLFASTLLARVDTLIQELNDLMAFLVLTAVALTGLGLSWVLQWLLHSASVVG